MPLEFETVGDTKIVIRRHFAASPDLVFRAHVDPVLIPRWMTGADPDWSMPVCISEARPGGAFRFEWRKSDGSGFHQEGTYLEIQPGRRILHVERMFLPEPTPENRIETRFEAVGGGTRMVLTMTLPDADALRAIIEMGMIDGMEQCYAALDGIDLAAA